MEEKLSKLPEGWSIKGGTDLVMFIKEIESRKFSHYKGIPTNVYGNNPEYYYYINKSSSGSYLWDYTSSDQNGVIITVNDIKTIFTGEIINNYSIF